MAGGDTVAKTIDLWNRTLHYIKDLEAFMHALVTKLIWGEFNLINLLF